MDNNKKLFEELLKADSIDPNGATQSERIAFTNMLDQQSKPKRSKLNFPQPDTWRIIMKSKITKLAAVAMVLVVLSLTITLLDKTTTSAYAIEQTLEALREVKNFRITIRSNSLSTELIMQINQQTGFTDHIRMNVLNSRNVTITVLGQSYSYNKQKNEVTLTAKELLTNDLNYKDIINSLIEQTNASGGQVKIKKGYNELAQKIIISVIIIRQDESIAGEFLIDPDNNLPLYMGIGNQAGQLNYMGPIEYNIDLPEDTFEFKIPQDAKVIDKRPEK